MPIFVPLKMQDSYSRGIGRFVPLTPTPKKPKKPKKSVGGFLGNLAGDIKDTAYGLPQGFKMTVEHPIRTAKAVGKSYVYEYTPLYHQIGAQLHGNWKDAEKWRKVADQRLYEHPFGPITDLMMGAGALAKVGVIPSTAGRTVKLATPAGKVVEKAVPANALRGHATLRAHQLADTLPAATPVVGKAARAGREIGAQARKKARANEHAAAGLKRATSKLSPDEQVASFLHTTLPHPKDVVSYVKQLTDSGDATQIKTAKIIAKPTVQALYLKPSPKMVRADAEIAKVGAQQEHILGSLLSGESKATRPWLHTLIARGADFQYDPVALAKAGLNPDEFKAANELAKEGRIGPGAIVHAADRNNYGKVISVQGDHATVHFVSPEGFEATVRMPVSVLTPQEASRLQVAKNNAGETVWMDNIPQVLTAPDGMSIPGMIDAAKADLKAAGRPEPKYLPDVQATSNTERIRYGGSGGGVQRLPGETKQNQALLFEAGKLMQDPAVLNKSYLHAVRYAHYTDLNNQLAEHAQVLPRSSMLPAGYEYLRRPARPFKATVDDTVQTVGRKPETIPRSVQTRADFEEWAAQHLEKSDVEQFLRADGGFTSANRAEAAVDKGNYLIVPKAFARQVKGEFVRTNNFVHLMNKYPIRVWRALVLNLRPAWLVNNVVGNTMMYAMHNTSPKGVAALLDSFKRAFPHKADAFDNIMEQHFSGQVSGTFIGTQRPTGVLSGTAGKVEKVVDTLANFDRKYEQVLRRASVKKQLLTHPNVKAMVKELGDDMGKWKAADEALRRNPAVAAQIEDKVNATLGNFTHMTGVERNVLRTLFPFWAWYRAITGVMVKLPLEQPAKVAILTRLGALGVDETMAELGVSRDDVPDFIRGIIPRGKPGADGRVPVWGTAWNPYQSGPSLMAFAAALGSGDRSAIIATLPGINPLFQQALTGRDYGAGIFNLPIGFVDSLPETQLIKDALGRQYKGTPDKPTVYDKNFRGDATRFVGVPKARLSVQAAKNRKQRQRSGY